MANEIHELEEWLDKASTEERSSPKGKGLIRRYVKLKKEAKELSPRVEGGAEESPTVGGIVGGLATEVGVSTSAKYAGAAAGSVLGPLGTITGYVGGAIGGGIAGSILAQKAEGRDTISWGRALSAGFINLIPVPGAQSVKVLGKSAGRGLSKMAEKSIRYGAGEGALTGAVEAQATSIIDKGELASFSETITYAGTGATFGAGLGAGAKKLSKKIKNKTPEEADEIIYSDPNGKEGAVELTLDGYQGDKDAAKPTLDREFELSRNESISTGATQSIETNYDPSKVGLMAKTYQKLPPSARRWIAKVTPSIVGRQIADVAIDYQNLIKTGEAIGGRVAKAVAREIELDPASKPSFDKFFQTGEIDDVIKEKKVVGTLQQWRDFADEQQNNLVNLLETDQISGMDEETKEILIANINRSRRDQNYLAQEYEIFTNDNFDVTSKEFEIKRKRAVEELALQMAEESDEIQLTNKYGSRVPDSKIKAQAEAKVQEIIDNAAQYRKLRRSGAQRQAVDAPIKARHLNESSNAALMDMMGLIKDPGERARGTVSRLTRMVARASADKRMSDMLVEMNLASKGSNPQKGHTASLDLRGGKSGLYSSPEVNIAVNQLYASNYINQSIDGAEGFFKFLDSGVGLSKAVKVLGNVPSYFVQVYGNMATLAQLGVPVFSPPTMWNSLRVAASDIDWFASNQKMSKKILDEIKDAEKYGIKGGNVFASDIRSNLENGVLVQKALDPFAQAYQVPDTAFRFYGWKMVQEQLKKVYPDMAKPERAEDLKNAAAKLLNDVYQNYDKVNPILRKGTQYGFLPQFATFTMELLRNQYNQGRQIKELMTGTWGSKLGINLGQPDMAASMRIGSTRAVFSAGVLGGTTAAMASWEASNGVKGDDRNRLIESYVPEYDENSPLLLSMSEEKDKFNYLNSSYLVPQRMISQAFMAGLDGTDETSLMAMARQEFLGEGAFFYRGLLKGALNIKEFGKEDKISTNPDRIKAAAEIIDYSISEMFKPGQAREIEKFIQAKRPGARFSTNEVIARQVGWRTNPFKMEKSGVIKSRGDYGGARQEKKSWGTTSKYDAENLQAFPGMYEAKYQEANQRYQAIMQKQVMHYNNFVHFHGDEQAGEMLKTAGVSKKELAYIRMGKVPPLPMHPSQTLEDRFEALGLDPSINTKENNKVIIDSLKQISDPFERKRMLNYVKGFRKKARAGLNEFEQDIDTMSSDNQIQILRDLFGGNTAYFKELARKNVISKESYYKLMQKSGY